MLLWDPENTYENKNITNTLTSDTCSAEPPCCKNDAMALVTANAIIKRDTLWFSPLYETYGKNFQGFPETSVRMQILNRIELLISNI